MGMDGRNALIFVLAAGAWHPPAPLRAGNVPSKAAVALGGARRIGAIGHPPLPVRLVRSSLAAYGPVRSPGLGDPIFRHPLAKRMVVGLDLAQDEFTDLKEPGERPGLEEVDPLPPGDVVHARSVALAGNFDNWVRRTLHAFEQEAGSHHACDDLRRKLQTTGQDFRLWLEVEITANKALLAGPKVAPRSVRFPAMRIPPGAWGHPAWRQAWVSRSGVARVAARAPRPSAGTSGPTTSHGLDQDSRGGSPCPFVPCSLLCFPWPSSSWEAAHPPKRRLPLPCKTRRVEPLR